MRRFGNNARRSAVSSHLVGTLVGVAALAAWPDAGVRAAEPEVLWGSTCIATRSASRDELSCLLAPDGRMTLWASVSSCEQVRVEEDGRVLAAQSQLVQSGCQLQFVADSPNAQSILAIKDAVTGNTFRTIKLDRSKPNILFRTNRIRKRVVADLDTAPSDLAGQSITISDTESLMDISLASGIAHYRKEEPGPALRSLAAAYDYAIFAGHHSVAAEAAGWRVDILRHGNSYAEASAIIQEATARLSRQGDLKVRMRLAWNLAILQDEMGNLAAGVEAYRQVVDDAERVADNDMLHRALPVLADAYARLGRRSEAEALAPRIDKLMPSAETCVLPRLLANKAWLGVSLAEQYPPPSGLVMIGKDTAQSLFLRALASVEKCEQPQAKKGNYYNGLAQVAMQEQRLTDAQNWLNESVKIKEKFIQDTLEITDTQARVYYLSGNPERAISTYDQLSALAKESGNGQHEFSCRAAVGKVEALAAAGRTEATTSAAAHACLLQDAPRLSPALGQVLKRRLAAASVVAERATSAPLTPSKKNANGSANLTGTDKNNWHIDTR